MGFGQLPQPGTEAAGVHEGVRWDHSLGTANNPLYPQSLASLSAATSSMTAPPTVLASAENVLSPGYMPPRPQATHDMAVPLASGSVVQPSHIPDNTLLRLEQ